jgi:hypothetical protein
MNANVSDAIQVLVPNSQYVITGFYPDYEINWISPKVAPVTNDQINAKYLELLAQVPAKNNKAKAEELLSATDWVNQPDVINTANNPHLLNQDAFLTYRTTVRQIAVNPPSTEVTNWPTLPSEIWSS